MIENRLIRFLNENKCSQQLLTKIKQSDWPNILHGDSEKLCMLTLHNFSKLDDTKIGMMNLTTQEEEEIKRLMLKAKEVLEKRREQFLEKYPRLTSDTRPEQVATVNRSLCLPPTLNNPYLI